MGARGEGGWGAGGEVETLGGNGQSFGSCKSTPSTRREHSGDPTEGQARSWRFP